jgi:hypothetical protein
MELNNKISEEDLILERKITLSILEEFQETINNYSDAFSEEKKKEYQDLRNINKKDFRLNNMILLEKASEAYIAHAPFPEYQEKYKKAFSIQKRFLKWFIDKDEIIAEIENINSLGKIFLPPSFVLFYLYKCYLPSKIRRTLSTAFELEKKYDRETRTFSEIGLKRNIQNQRNREKKGTFLVKNNNEEILQKISGYLKEIKMDEMMGAPIDEILLSFFSGRCEKMFLIPIYHKAIPLFEISENEKLILFFELFRLILKDEKWLTEQEFETGDALYSNNYRKYKILTMRKFIYKK